MSSYFNNSLLDDLFAGVEVKMTVEDRLKALRAMTDEFVNLALNSLERAAYDLSSQGWEPRQIANELGVSRNYIPTMIDAHAARAGLPSPVRRKRTYEHAVDISGLVSRQARLRADEARQRSG